MEHHTCCVTGHRDVPADRASYVSAMLEQEIRTAISKGYSQFISGFADGADLLFARIVANLKPQHPSLRLIAAIPHAGRMKCKNPVFHALIPLCDQVNILSEEYSFDCYARRNRWMVQQSSCVIAVFDGRKKGGTWSTLRYAILSALLPCFIRADPMSSTKTPPLILQGESCHKVK